MKKLVFLTIIGFFTLTTFSQNNVVFKDTLKNQMGDTVKFQYDINDTNLPLAYEINGFVSNISGSSKDISIRRVVIQYIASATDQICWANQCIAYSYKKLDVSTFSQSIDAGADVPLIDNDLAVFHYVHSNQVGTTILKYYLMNGSVVEDSLVAVYTLTGPKVTLTFKVDMSTLIDFSSTDKVYVEGTFGDQTQMVTTDNIHYFVSLPVDLNTNYTYKYATDTYTEPNERSVDITNENVTLSDNFNLVDIHQKTGTQELMSSPYPNPALNSITVNYNVNNNQQANIVIVNAIGKKVQNYNLYDSNGKIEMNISSLPTGIYFVNLEQKGVIRTSKKIIKVSSKY